MNEIDLIERIRSMSLMQSGSAPTEAEPRASASGLHRTIELGIGDDCAIYRPRAGEDLLFTTDQMIEDVHFTRRNRHRVSANERWRAA